MRDSKIATAATALVMLARGPSRGRTRRLRPARPDRARATAIAASLLVPAALAVTATAGAALASTAPLPATAGSAFAAKLVITTASTLPMVTPGAPYSVKLAAAGGTTPCQWSLASGSLPGGLKLGKSSGVISGTTATGSVGFTVRVTDAQTPAASATKNMTLNVVTPMTGGTFQVGSAPAAIAFDGASMWGANSGGATVTELSAG